MSDDIAGEPGWIVAPDGAYTIGNAGENEHQIMGRTVNVTNWGQNASEDVIKGLFQVPAFNIGNAVSVLTQALSRLPADAIRLFAPLIPDWIEDDLLDIATAVGKLINALDPSKIPMRLHQFTEWLGDTFQTVWTELKQIIDILGGLIITPINAAVQAVKDWWNRMTGKTQHLTETGGYDAGQLVGNIPKNIVEGLEDLGDNVAGFFKGLYDSWFGTNTGDGTLTQATYTIESIKDAVINGYTVVTFTSDTANYLIPAHLECTAAVINGGESGSGNFGGLHGSFISVPITDQLVGLTHLDIRVGTAGNLSYVRAAHATPHTGAVLVEGAVHGSKGGITDAMGLLVGTASQPGSGGNGGTAGQDRIMPEPGESSTLAAGGAAGSSGSFGGSGGAGGSVSAGSAIKCGGGGGGGGGGAGTVFNGGGNGGPGGYPGGGGGGRGNGFSASNGSVGAGAPGVVWLFFK